MTTDKHFTNTVHSAGQAVFRFFASYGLGVVVLSFMLVLTLLGTLEQVHYGLYEVQKKYFDSLFLVHRLFGVIPVPLPGVYLLMVVLFVNMLCGALIRAPWYWKRPGMLIAHSGILFLLVGGFVAHHFSLSGSMHLYEGQAGSSFYSYYDWVIEARRHAPEGTTVRYEIPARSLKHLGPADTRVFENPELPFDIEVAGYAMNCKAMPSAHAPHVVDVDGFYLQTLPKETEAERNVAGAYLTVRSGSDTQKGIVWGLERAPFVVRAGNETWSFAMARKTWPLPFTIVLDKFTMEKHPNTDIAKVFLSDVTKIDGYSQEKVKIAMNEPLRYRGYTLFQATWGPERAPPGTPLYSGFAVVKNPADHWPLYACIVVGIGMLIHFFQKLSRHLVRRRSA